MKAEMFRKEMISWGKENYQNYPWRSAKEPIYQLIAEILLQRTRAEQVVPVFTSMIEKFPTLVDLSKMPIDEVQEAIQSLGLHWRARLIHGLIHTISVHYGGLIPESQDELMKLPGVGKYVSSAYQSFHRNHRAIIIDSNVVRIYGRFFGFEYDGETRRKKWLEDFADELTPKTLFKRYNYALLDFSKLICKRKPKCSMCPISQKCTHYSTRVEI
jgi:A/G-specific adenine glycosylase